MGMNFQDVIRDVHDPSTHSFKTVGSAAATLFAVVNTSAAGDSVNNIGFATVAISTPTLFAVVNTGAAGVGNSMVTINPRTDYFGLVSVSGNVAVSSLPALAAGANFIGLVSVRGKVGAFLTGLGADGSGDISEDISGDGSGSSSTPDVVLPVGAFPMLYTGTAWDKARIANIANATTGVGLLGAGILGFDGTNYRRVITGTDGRMQANVTVNNPVALAAGTQFIGLVTAWTRNAGTTKTLVPLPVGLGNNSLATVAVPTNSNKINLTQLILNSNVTTEIAIKSGVTYLTGNASLGVTLFPGGGFVMNGAPDSPVWISLPSGAMVIEKRDPGGTVSKVGGNVIYFDE